MRKLSGIFSLVAWALGFFISVIPVSYGHTLVFGPELFHSENGKMQRIRRSFSVQDTNQKFYISVQNGASNEKDLARGAVNINRKPVFPPAAIGKQSKMFVKRVTLQKQNEISVDVSSDATTPAIVTIISLEEQTKTVIIPQLGEAIDIEGYATVIFPAGSFDFPQKVTIYVTASPAMQDIFESHATGPRLPYEIRINTGNMLPKKDIEVSLNYPDSFFSSVFQIHVFAHMHDNPEAPGLHDRFFMLNSGLDDKVNMAMATLPKHAFSNHHGRKGTYEAIITVGLIH